jgi:hypothetical protein
VRAGFGGGSLTRPRTVICEPNLAYLGAYYLPCSVSMGRHHPPPPPCVVDDVIVFGLCRVESSHAFALRSFTAR